MDVAEKLIVGTVGTGGPWPKYSIVDSYKCIADLERQLLLAQQLQLVHLDALRRVSAALLPEVKS